MMMSGCRVSFFCFIHRRILGAEKASGAVLTFLDSHCECSPGWLEPLLGEILYDRRAVVCPVIDSVSAETFRYNSMSANTGGFDWDFAFRWYLRDDLVEKVRPKRQTFSKIYADWTGKYLND